MSSPPAPPKSSDVAKSAGRGGLFVLGAKAYFIVVGLAQQALLKQAIGLDGYGAISRVFAMTNVVNNVMVSGSIQGVSRTVAGAKGREDEAFRATLRVHVPLAVGAGLLFAAAAPFLVAFQKAPHILPPLLMMAAVVTLYGTYAPLVGALNGRGRFDRQAMLDVTFATLRTVGLVAVGRLFVMRGLSGTLGAVLGFVLAVVAIVPLALRWSGTGKASAEHRVDVPTTKGYASVLAPLFFAQLFTNLLMQIDLTLLGRFLSEGAAISGLRGEDAAKASDEWVAVYRACQLFAFLPYQLLVSVTAVLFPMLASAKADGDAGRVREYVQRGSRLATVLGGLFVAVIVFLPGSLVGLAYGRDVGIRGESTLRILAVGQGAFALFSIASTVLASVGRERLGAMASFAAVLLVGAGCFAVVPAHTFGVVQLERTAMATTTALVVALAVASFLVRRETGAFVPAKTLARVGLSVAALGLAGTRIPVLGKVTTIVAAGGGALAYLILLVVTGEVGREEVGAVRALVRKKR
ncbi:MAG: lipopolysaccharide biosynthesis protein [Polyangiaceae bacterium]